MEKTAKLQIVIDARNNAMRELDKLNATAGRLGSRFEKELGLIGRAANAAKYALAGLAGSMTTAGFFAVRSAAQFEQNRIAFESMLGSADEASSLLKRISDFASKTPFDLPQVVEGSKRLLAYNISAEKIIPTFKMLGDIASGVGTDKLPQLITAFGQVQAKGKLMGQELLQFTEAGVNLGGELQKIFGVTRGELEKMISSGKVTSDNVTDALRRMTSEGGLFFQGMERQSKSFNGIMSNLRDDIGNIAREIVGINQRGDIREGSIFAMLKKSAEDMMGWLSANKEKIANEMIVWMKKAIDGAKKLVDELGGPRGILNRLKSTADIIFNKMLPAIGKLTVFLVDNGKAILYAVAAWEALKVATSAISFVSIIGNVGRLTGGFLKISSILSGTLVRSLLAVAAAFAPVAAAAAPFLIGGAIITGIVAGAYLIIKNWDKVKRFGAAVAGSISRAFQRMGSAIKNAFSGAMDWIRRKLGIIGRLVNKAIRSYNRIPGLPNIKEFNFSRRATGGTVTAGRPYMVGENGPEMFVPTQSGRIEQPRDAVQSAPGVTVNIDLRGATLTDETLIDRVRTALADDYRLATLGVR